MMAVKLLCRRATCHHQCLCTHTKTFLTTKHVFSAAAHSTSKQTHYEVLGVSNTCSQRDIKRAFLHLSKKLHPDMSPTSKSGVQHNKFVLLNNAYSTLSKPASRAIYDNMLRARQRKHKIADFYGMNSQDPLDRVIFRDTSIWSHRDRSEDARYAGSDRRYYGVSWIKQRLPNSYVVACIVAFMTMGVVVHYYAAKILTASYRRRDAERDANISHSYRKVRERALGGGRQEQLEAFSAELQRDSETRVAVDSMERNRRFLAELRGDDTTVREV